MHTVACLVEVTRDISSTWKTSLFESQIERLQLQFIKANVQVFKDLTEERGRK
jgi:hypothetical protein